MDLLFFLFGFASLTGQILLLREILVVFHGTEISIGIFFCAWLAAIGIGASVGARYARRTTEALRSSFLNALVGLGFSLLGQIVLIRSIPGIFGIAPAELAPLSGIFTAVVLGTFVTAFLTGFLFPVGCAVGESGSARTIARLYVMEGLGGLAGGVIFTFVLVHFLSPLAVAGILAVLLATGGLLQAIQFRLCGALVGAALLLVIGLVTASPIGNYLNRWSVSVRWQALHPGLELLVSKSTPYQLIEIAHLGKQLSLFGNGKIVSSFPDSRTADRLAALIVAQRPATRRILLIGGGIGSVVSSLLHYPIDRLDVVEPDPWALRIAGEFLPAEEAQALRDPRVNIIHADGRFYVNRLGKDRYDAIVCLVPDPVSAFWNRYYTREFFETAAKALTASGIFVTGVTSAENFWGPEVASYAGSVYHTLKEAFSSVKGTPGDETLFFASPQADGITLDPEILQRRYETLGGRPFDPAGFKTILPPPRSAFVQKELERSPHLINTDFKPLSTALAMILWGRFSGTQGLEALNALAGAGLKVYLIPLVFFLVGKIAFRARWGPRMGKEDRFQTLLAMTAVGAGAMGVQIVLIYGYQSLFGHVFERIGLMAGLFMAGLVAGGLSAALLLHRVRNTTGAITILLGLFVGLCLLIPETLRALIGREPLIVEGVILSLVFASGAVTGVTFPLVASRHLDFTDSLGETSGWTDAADHYGAAAGALITGALLLPLLGTEEACWVLALVLATPVILILSERALRRFDPVLDKYRSRRSPSFPYVRTSWVLVLSVAAAFAWHLWGGSPGTPSVTRFPEEILAKVSGSERFTFKETPYPHYVGENSKDSGFTVSLSTIPPAGDIRGYGGPINLLLSVSSEGLIKGVRLVESRETPSYMRGLEQWLDRLSGRSVLGPFSREIDAMTGATITCRAIVRIVEKTGRTIANPLLGVEGHAKTTGQGLMARELLRDVRLWLVVLLMGWFVFAFYSQSGRLRKLCLLASLVMLGLYLNTPFTALDVAGLFHAGMPAQGTLWRNVVFVCALSIAVLWGQAFCGFLCPFGALQEFLSASRLRQRATVTVERPARYLKFVLLSALLVCFLMTDDTVWFSFSPLQHVFGDHGRRFLFGRLDGWIWALCALVLGASLFYFRFWCRYLCPAGAFFALFNKVSLLRKSAPVPIPGLCDLGVTSPDDVDCIRCHRCLHRKATAGKDKVGHEDS